MTARVAAAAVLLASAVPVPAAELAPLSWLAGCWSNPDGDTGSGEYWLPIAGDSMLGVGRVVRGGKTLEYEYLRLHVDAQGRIVYTATPSRQEQTAFIASHVGADTATFENPAHDFPQKISYTKTGPAALSVRIEGERAGKSRSIEFRFERVACAR